MSPETENQRPKKTNFILQKDWGRAYLLYATNGEVYRLPDKDIDYYRFNDGWDDERVYKEVYPQGSSVTIRALAEARRRNIGTTRAEKSGRRDGKQTKVDALEARVADLEDRLKRLIEALGEKAI